MTGEPMPVDVAVGDTVVGGSLNTYGRVLVRAVRVGADTQLARMAKLVSDAQNNKAPVQRMADRVAAVFVPAVLVIAAVTMACWLLAGQTARVGIHRGRRGADHRLPVCARAGHADRDPGRHRTRRAAGHPDQGPAGAGDHRRRRHRRVRQDRNPDDRRDGGARNPTPARRRRRRGPRPRGGGRVGIRASGGGSDRGGRPRPRAGASQRPRPVRQRSGHRGRRRGRRRRGGGVAGPGRWPASTCWRRRLVRRRSR